MGWRAWCIGSLVLGVAGLPASHVFFLRRQALEAKYQLDPPRYERIQEIHTALASPIPLREARDPLELRSVERLEEELASLERQSERYWQARAKHPEIGMLSLYGYGAVAASSLLIFGSVAVASDRKRKEEGR